MDSRLELALPVGEQVDLDVGVGGAAQVHGGQVLGLVDRHDE